jgi:hypothetical protein
VRGALRASRSRSRSILIGAALSLTTCTSPLDLCPPVDGRVSFFSKGDCALTRASFFAGHEWITFLANDQLPDNDRFTDEEIDAIVEGNRRTDFPKEMLVHLNTSVFAYTAAIVEYQDRPENQPVHFLLGRRNTSTEAAADSLALMRAKTVQAMKLWITERERALALLGSATHTLQDGFSDAHTKRDQGRDWCLLKVKAFIDRDDGYDDPEIEYHGDDGATIGHTTTEDSIYRPGRDCHSPAGREEVEACFSTTADRARYATRDYLRMVRDLVIEGATEPEVDQAFDTYAERHFRFCDQL